MATTVVKPARLDGWVSHGNPREKQQEPRNTTQNSRTSVLVAEADNRDERAAGNEQNCCKARAQCKRVTTNGGALSA